MPVVLFCFFMRPGTKSLATTTTIENLPVVSCLYSPGGHFPARFGSCRKNVCRPVRRSYLWVLLVLCVNSERIKPHIQAWSLSNIEKWNEKLYHRKYKMMILREIFSYISKYSLLMMNFERMAFFLFFFLFGCLKSEFLMFFF